MNESFGARLRAARERRHVTVADIAARTKISASLFDAIERDDASRWPSGIFRRSFMRAYAEAVGLDPDAIVHEFLERFPDPAAGAPAAPRPGTTEGTPPPPSPAAPAEAHQPGRGSQALRLTLVDTGLPFTGGRLLVDARRRWAAAAWDLGSLVALALTVFVFLDAFWAPFGMVSLCYYAGGILLLGNSPGVCLFAPRPVVDDAGPEPQPTRAARPRHAELPVRAPEPAVRSHRFRAGRHRHVRS
ncbi:MAG: helix-turn-helix domain-containing protein [Vicinamibacterales bacterium]